MIESNLPNYAEVSAALAALNLPLSISELHGVLCAYLCADKVREAENYLRAFLIKEKELDPTRQAAQVLFQIFSVSQQQIDTLDFAFRLLLPDDEEPLRVRAQAFGEWCVGFTDGLTLAGVRYDHLKDDESQNTLLHLTEFGELDYDSLSMEEDDEKAYMEVNEYARMAVLRLHSDLHESGSDQSEHRH